MTKEERAEYKSWLASLKAGDEVAIKYVGRGDPGRPHIVKSVWSDSIVVDQGKNPALQFKLDNGRTWRSAYHGPMQLTPVTNEVRRFELIHSARNRLWGIRNEKLTDEKALRIVAILDEPEPTK